MTPPEPQERRLAVNGIRRPLSQPDRLRAAENLLRAKSALSALAPQRPNRIGSAVKTYPLAVAAIALVGVLLLARSPLLRGGIRVMAIWAAKAALQRAWRGHR